MHRLVSLAVFLFLVIIATGVGGQFAGGDWYFALFKPSWTPSPVVMSAVWAFLYVLMAFSAWLVWDVMKSAAVVALSWWLLQLVLGICWSWAFFGTHHLGLSVAIVSMWLLVVLIAIRTFRSIRPVAAGLMIPLAAWLIFIGLLNFGQWQMNGGGLASVL